MKTRCKFQVVEVATMAYNTVSQTGEPKRYAERIKLNAVCTDEDPENQSFSKWTPQGTLEIFVTNPAVVGTFAVEDFYYLDLIPVPAKA